MSEGSIKLGEGQYRRPRKNIDKYSNDLFFDEDWISDHGSKRFLVDGLGVHEEKIPAINKAIGSALVRIQDGSYLDWYTLGVMPTDYLYMDEQGTADIIPVTSTLPPHVLISLIRRDASIFIRDIIDLVGSEDMKNQAYLIPETHKHSIKNSLILTLGDSDIGVFKHDDFLKEESRGLLELFGEGTVEAVQNWLRVFAEDILGRAELSFGSFRNDLHDYNHIRLNSDDPNIEYSTLNPKDLVRKVRESVKMALINIIFGLPKKTSSRILERLNSANEQRQVVESAPH